MRPNFKYFKIGDIVEATNWIWRVDKKTVLKKGDKAEVYEIFQLDENSPQIINIKVEGKFPIGDLVCYDTLPLKLAAQPFNNPKGI